MTAWVLSVLLCVTMVRPARTFEITDEPTEPSTQSSAELPMEETNPTTTDPVPQETVNTTEPEATKPEATEPEETKPVMTEPAVTEPKETEPKETEPKETEPGATEPEATEPEVTEPEVTAPEPTAPGETEPEEAEEESEALMVMTADAGQQDGDLSSVWGQGIRFGLFNYNTNINKSSGSGSWRPISTYFTFRDSAKEIGTDASVVDIPNPSINSVHDEDGFTKHHATVERVLGGLPVLDLTRNADGTPRENPGISSAVRSLAYLFSSGDHAVTAYYPSNTILRRNGSHYWYNSASCAVDFDIAANIFRLRNYVERNSTTADFGAGFGDFLPFTYTGGLEVGSSESGIPYHVNTSDTDYWFGMTMQVSFFQTKGGRLGDQNMIFSFSGDDDVWVFVDDVLVLDLGGTHGTANGSINFATGEVLQYLTWRGANSTEESRKYGSSTSFPTTIRACFDAAGRTPNGGWSADGTTFADFTEHTLKFFYLERGAAVANCKLDFRLPTLPDESLTVTKDLIGDSNEDVRDFIADSLSYRFRVMKADAAGNATDEYFITAGTAYDLLQNGSKVGTGIVGEDGCFQLKAGQSAQFTQMLYKGNGATSYVVEEIMPDELVGQYAGVEYLVSGAGGETVTQEYPAEPFTAFQSGVLSAEQTQTVTFRNRVDTTKLNTMTIRKLAAPGTVIPADQVFQIQVKLGGNLLPVGTRYTVAQESRSVENAGIILLRAGESALIEQGILSGTEYEITEVNPQQDGYRPSYSGTVLPDGNVECSSDGACGTFPLAGEVQLTVTNADYDFFVRIPIWKTVVSIQESGTFHFQVEQVALSGDAWQVVKTFPDVPITVTGAQAATQSIIIGYDGGTEGTFYYRISEKQGSGAYIYDRSFYLVEVTVAGGVAEITGILKNGQENADAVAFVNRAVTSLTVTKTITGITEDMEFPFAVQVFLADVPFTLPQPAADAPYTVDGNRISFSLGHGDAVTIPCIPIGATVTVEECDYEGFQVFHTLEGVDDAQCSGAIRDIAFSNAPQTIHFTNQSGFRLPNTGGPGTSVYTAGGSMLFLCSGAAFMYSQLRKERRKKRPPDASLNF